MKISNQQGTSHSNSWPVLETENVTFLIIQQTSSNYKTRSKQKTYIKKKYIDKIPTLDATTRHRLATGQRTVSHSV